MKITFVGHAGLWIETEDVKILCDPWLHKNPAFFESWSVYPDNSNIDWDKIIKETDIVYVSHVHQDHFDKKFLTELYQKNKQIKVLLPDFRFCVLKEYFQEIGFDNFITKELKIGNTTAVTFPSETIDREREDSSICVNDGNVTFLNWNDSMFTPEHKDNVLKRFKKIDWAAGQFSGASWWPSCYNYDYEKKSELITNFRKRKVDHYQRMIDYLDVKKIIPIAGPACFLQKNMYHLNNIYSKSIFFDSWDVPEFDELKEVHRVTVGDEFTYDNLQDRKIRPFDKEKFILDNQYVVDYNISKDKLKTIDKKIIDLFSDLLENNHWLNKYIKSKIFMNVKGYKCFCLNFRNQKVEIVDEPIKKGAYYIIHFEQKVIYDLLENNITDWENSAFLSCTCTFERNPDVFNPWMMSFFKNLNNDRLDKIYKITQSSEVIEGKMVVGDYEINRYCPHMQYDLMHHSKIDLKNKTIQCLGHGWKWDLETCEGINCNAKIICNKIIRKDNGE